MISLRVPFPRRDYQSSRFINRMTETPLIEIENASYQAGGFRILDNVSWQVDPGQHWAVVGPNGCGKTTLLRLAAGYIWPNIAGTVRRCGHEQLDLRELRRKIGWVSNTDSNRVPRDEYVLNTVVSGRFAQLGLQPLDWDPPLPEDFDRAMDCLHMLGCEELVEKQFGVLSQGEQQNVMVTRARMADPLLLILDEPCDGMDPGARERFLMSLEKLLKSPDTPTLVLVTHHIEQIIPQIQNTLVMADGRINQRGSSSEILTPDRLSEVYGVPVSRVIEERGRFWPLWR